MLANEKNFFFIVTWFRLIYTFVVYLKRERHAHLHGSPHDHREVAMLTFKAVKQRDLAFVRAMSSVGIV